MRHPQSADVGAHHELVLARVLRHDLVAPWGHLPHHLVERPLLRRDRVVDVVGLVVRDVHLEPAVAVDVRGGERGPTTSDRVEAEIAALGESSGTVIYEDRVRTGGREENQVEVAVAVEVDQRRAGRVPVARADARGGRHVRELPTPEVAVESAASFGAGKEQVRAPVTIHVAERDTRSLGKATVADERRIADLILERDTTLATLHRREALTT